jgi:hypothetical protein
MPEIKSDRPFVLFARLVLADAEGAYERAAEFQRQLAGVGWSVSRINPEQPTKSKRRRPQTAAAKDGVA